MEEKITKQSEAFYFVSAIKVLKGQLIMTNERLLYSGIQERLKVNHGKLGNVLRDNIEKKMGYDNLPVEEIFDIPLKDASAELKRAGLSKRLVVTDHRDGKSYKLTINKKAERNEWPEMING